MDVGIDEVLYASLLSGFFLNPSQKTQSGGALDGVGMLLNELLFAYDFEQFLFIE